MVMMAGSVVSGSIVVGRRVVLRAGKYFSRTSAVSVAGWNSSKSISRNLCVLISHGYYNYFLLIDGVHVTAWHVS